MRTLDAPGGAAAPPNVGLAFPARAQISMGLLNSPWRELVGTKPPPIGEVSAAPGTPLAACRASLLQTLAHLPICCCAAQVGLADAAAAATAAAAAPPLEVPRRLAHELSQAQFVLQYLEPNLPVLIQVSAAWQDSHAPERPGPEHLTLPMCTQGATEGWAAAADWVAPGGGIDLDTLQHRFGTAHVMVTDTARWGAGPRLT